MGAYYSHVHDHCNMSPYTHAHEFTVSSIVHFEAMFLSSSLLGLGLDQFKRFDPKVSSTSFDVE